jgi:serine/threonine protein phosphatase 1
MTILGRLRDRSPKLSAEPARTPEGMRIYAVGDIHGRADLLERLNNQIQQDAAQHAEKALQLIYLGDYVDRGPQSQEVLELLTMQRPKGLTPHFLMGNHEQAMLSFLFDPLPSMQWLSYGGLATIASYAAGAWEVDRNDLLKTRAALRAAIPMHHRAFLQSLALSLRFGDYLFVHAGIRPDVPIEQQQALDLLWIRDRFLSHTKAHPFVVVHGHHVVETVDVRSNRIGIDTGAYATGCLSCLILDGAERLYLDTRQGGPRPLHEATR